MASKAERKPESGHFGRIFRNIALGALIVGGAVLWGIAVFNVAVRTM